MESILLSRLEELLSRSGYAPKKGGGLEQNFNSLSRGAEPFLLVQVKADIGDFKTEADRAYAEAYKNGRLDLFFAIFMSSWYSWHGRYKPKPSLFRKVLSDLIESSSVDDILTFSKVGLWPDDVYLPGKGTAILLTKLLQENEFKKAHKIHDFVKKGTLTFDKDAIQSIYSKYSKPDAEGLCDIALITEIAPKDEDAQRFYDYCLSKLKTCALEDLNRIWKIKPKFKEEDVQKAYLGLLDVLPADRDYERVGRIRAVSGIEPCESARQLIQNEYEHLLGNNDWEKIKKFKEATGLTPSLDESKLRNKLEILLRDSSRGGSSQLNEFLGIFGKEWLEADKMQKVYGSILKSRELNRLNELPKLIKYTGIKPTFDEDTIQKEYSFYLFQGWIDGLEALKTAFEIQPKFDKNEVRKAFIRTLNRDPRYLKQLMAVTNTKPDESDVQDEYRHLLNRSNLDLLKELVDTTDLKPNESDVQDEYRRALNSFDFNSIEKLNLACNIKPNFTKEEVNHALEALLDKQTYGQVNRLLDITGYKIEKANLETLFKSSGINKEIIDKIDNDLAVLVLEAISNGKLKSQRLNSLAGIQESNPMVLYDGALNGSGLTYGEKISILAIGVVTRKPENLKKAYEIFGKELIDGARFLIDRNKVFEEFFSKNLDKIKAGDVKTCEDVLIKVYSKIHEQGNSTADLEYDFNAAWYDAKEASNGADKVNKTKIRTWRRGLEDIFHNEKVGSCVFYPRGGRCGSEGDILDYIRNPNVELIDMYFNDEKFRVASATCYKTKDEAGKTVLLVDSVEAGKRIAVIGRTRWIDLMMNAIRDYSKTNGFDYIFVNKRVTAGKATDFNKRVATKEKTVKLYVDGGPYVYLEAFNSEAKERYLPATGYVIPAS